MQAGNLAHLLNHSCAPNCHSRLVCVWDDGASSPREHVMLFAKVDRSAPDDENVVSRPTVPAAGPGCCGCRVCCCCY